MNNKAQHELTFDIMRKSNTILKPVCKLIILLICRLIYCLIPAKFCSENKSCFFADLCTIIGIHFVATQYYKKYLEKHPNNEKILKKLASSHCKVKEYNIALDIYLSLQKLSDDFEVPYQIAKIYEKQGRYQEAIEKYNETLLLNPCFVCAYYNWANILDEMDCHDEAISKYRQALALSPNNSEILIGIGLAHEAKGEYKEACKNFKKAIMLNPNLAEAYFAWGTVLEKIKDYNGAIEKYEKAIDIDPHYSDVYARWGEVHYLLGDFDSAINKLKIAIQIDPEQSLALYDLACVYVKVGQISEAFKYFRKALKIDSTIIEEIENNANLTTLKNTTQYKSLYKLDS